MMVCLIFHTAITINRKNWRITIKLHFYKKANVHSCWDPASLICFCSLFNDPTTPSPSPTPLPSSTKILFEWPHIRSISHPKVLKSHSSESNYLLEIKVWRPHVSQFFQFCWFSNCFGCQIVSLIIQLS